MNEIIREMITIFIQSPGIPFIISGHIEPVIPEHPILTPFIIIRIDDLLSPEVLPTFEPIFLKNTATMLAVAAHAALLSFREDDVSFIVDCYLIAGSVDVR